MEYFVSVINDDENEMMYLEVDSVEKDTLKQLQKKIGGYVDVANHIFEEFTEMGYDCWVADDSSGKPLTLVHNMNGYAEPIFGNLVFAKHDDEGNTLGFNKLECVLLVAMLLRTMGQIVPIKLLCPRSENAEWEMILRGLEDIINEHINEEEEEMAQA